jgi:FAD/FMN-containing dehydrogenase
MRLEDYSSWGRYPNIKANEVIELKWLSELPKINDIQNSVLPYGYGKSYGDSCLNENGTLLETQKLNKFIELNESASTITCEAGVTLNDVLNFITPKRYFLAVTPGTKHISIGGAIANDVHGKNHHKVGTFGTQTVRFELLRSNGEKLICSREENSELFSASIGGLGLTGLITWAEFKIRKVSSPFIDMESIKFYSLDEFFEINEESDKLYDYTVAWVDLTASGSQLGRGLYNRGNHLDISKKEEPKLKNKDEMLTFPLDYPFINPFTVQVFNMLYFNKQMNKKQTMVTDYNPFFYPLDAVGKWNRAYGPDGFLQYQFVIPFDNVQFNLKKIFKYIFSTGLSSFLTVLKTFGDIKSPGMISFPRSGVTMAVDFRYNGEKTLDILKVLNLMIRDLGGVLYPAKDAQMSSDDFWTFYPQAKEFTKYIDPKFSSSFGRRVGLLSTK